MKPLLASPEHKSVDSHALFTRRSYLRTTSAALTSGLIASATSHPLLEGAQNKEGDSSKGKRLIAYVGTFSSPLRDVLPTQVDLPPGNGKGIHIFEVDKTTGAFTPLGITELGTSPSCLAIDPTGEYLYSANETDRVGEERHGTVTSWKIDRKTGLLSEINTVTSGGAGPTYVSLHPTSKHLLVANYFGGSVAVLPIGSKGELLEASDVQVDVGVIGPTKATHAPEGSFAFSGHDRTHAHMIEADASGRLVVHVDLGLDRLYLWRFDPDAGKLHPAPTPQISLPPGDGPRHFSFHPNEKWFYSIQEEGSTVVFFEFDASAGTLLERQTISTLPPKFAGSNFCSEILVSADGKYLYAGNRLHDSIATFEIAPDGSLRYLNEVWSQGNYPRSFTLDPSGRWLVCCNQRSDNLAIFRVDLANGGLTFTGQYVPVGNPSVVRFLETT